MSEHRDQADPRIVDLRASEIQKVYCVLCVDHVSGKSRTHIFSTVAKRAEWVRRQPEEDLYVHYDYVVDDPDRMDREAGAFQ